MSGNLLNYELPLDGFGVRGPKVFLSIEAVSKYILLGALS